MPKTNIEVELVGQDGNAFAIMGAVTKALRQNGYTADDIDEYRNEASSGDYNNLLRVTMEWVEVV
mgnify:FL=1